MRTLSAFSKRFVGAGHSENGGGQGAKGTLPSARRGVWGYPPQKIFEIWMLKGAIWCNLGDLKGQNCISFAQLYLPSFSIK